MGQSSVTCKLMKGWNDHIYLVMIMQGRKVDEEGVQHQEVRSIVRDD